MSDPIVIIQSGFLGDAVLASGMLRALAAVDPAPPVGLVVRAPFAELFEGHPALSHLHRFDKQSRQGAATLLSELKQLGYRTAFLPHRSYRSAVIARKAGIGRRIGFRQSEGGRLLTDRVEYEIARHETERNAMLLERAGIATSPDSRRAWLVPSPGRVEEMRGRFAGNEPLLLAAPGSVWRTKRWPAERFIEAVDRLRREGARVLLIGAPDERKECETIAAAAGLPPEENLAGELSLADLLALISIASRVISNDSAPLHLAESVGTPVTAIFGPTVPEFGFGPIGPGSSVAQIDGLSCRPCRIHGGDRCPIGTHECMTRITTDVLLAALGPGR